MKLRYQSMPGPAEWGGYPAVLQSTRRKVEDTDRVSEKCAHAAPRSDQIEAIPRHCAKAIVR
jgi:hypothetical protein